MKISSIVLLAGIVAAGVASTAQASVPWVNPSGTNPVLSWENGQSDNGLFGSPTVIGDTFFFIANSNFDAQSFGGGAVVTSDTLRVRIHAQPGRSFSQVVFASAGDYTVFGDGASANITGGMTINDLNTPRTASDTFHTSITPLAGSATSMPVVGNSVAPELGSWSGFSMIDFASQFGIPDVTDLDLIFSNTCVAIALPGETASIVTLPNTQGSFSLQIVPAPGTMLTGLLGVGLIARRRR